MKANVQKNTHLQAAQSQAKTKACKRVFFSATQEKLFFKISSPSENKKYPTTQPDTTRTMTTKHVKDNGLQIRWTRTPAGNRRLAQWRVTWLIEHSTSHQLL
jgi:glycerophosphoryl diester phosphodiesterase